MRIKLTFSIDKNTALPINYNYLLTSLIYSILSSSSRKFSHFLHEEGFRDEGKRFKLFTYSQLLFAKKRIQKDKIVNLGENIVWFISSPKDEFVQHFVDGLFKKKTIRLGKELLIPEKVETLPGPEFKEVNYFTCLSPITMSTKVENGEDNLQLHYYRLGEDGFAEKLRQNLLRKYRLLYQKEPEESTLEIKFDQDYINRHQQVSRLIDFKGIKIKGWMVPFWTKGSQELVKVGYGCGFGDKNSAGFGMVRIVPQSAPKSLAKI